MATAKSDDAYPASESGYWTVKLSKSFLDEGYLYKPSHEDVTVDESILKKMVAAGVLSGAPIPVA